MQDDNTLPPTKMENANGSFWHLLENGVIHTSWLSEKDANEMQARYASKFEDCDFSVFYCESL